MVIILVALTVEATNNKLHLNNTEDIHNKVAMEDIHHRAATEDIHRRVAMEGIHHKVVLETLHTVTHLNNIIRLNSSTNNHQVDGLALEVMACV